ncbi:putative Serine-rich protein-related [Quillaja saponaria]|uniref:Serine-rich protein-related n=1 Tax=Quillaja saponaria TaxID=32244 RepID=A0AAD7PP71_QUISA|nr:putative Serine-rich protein-related [Quillaja saponaria]
MASSYSRTKSEPFSLSKSYSSSSAFASSTSSFSPQSSTFSSTRVKQYRNHSSSASASSVRFPIHRPTSPGRSISVRKQSNNAASSNQKKTCMCSPTTHPGSFRCSLHKGGANRQHGQNQTSSSSYHSSSRLNFRRSAMTNSLVRIGGVEGDLVRRALSALIRPSSHQQRRRAGFQLRPSRLSIMSKAENL